jgi:hypothetical protein
LTLHEIEKRKKRHEIHGDICDNFDHHRGHSQQACGIKRIFERDYRIFTTDLYFTEEFNEKWKEKLEKRFK